ncbi:hypothetical protein MLIT_47830 [Mycolicibacterium litorale]|uniref:Uncharacterized protein n=1 Tax=Mycolicibacterium litorale TaxID=758802 RepID=A0AAD1IQE5_9MYCO|nr:hypothetical protein MLIT_47830 [Mycolicibacterium litorale]
MNSLWGRVDGQIGCSVGTRARKSSGGGYAEKDYEHSPEIGEVSHRGISFGPMPVMLPKLN